MGTEMVILADSNIIIRLFRGDAIIQKKLNKIGHHNIALSLVTHAEDYIGTKKDKMKEARKILEAFRISHFNQEISKIFNGLILNYSASHRIKIPDALIAAAAIANNYPLYTDNKKDFDFIPEIQFYNPKG